ncbi:SHOCT domain-containing protein [Candidatus Mycobacterium methanotrophicum]|uniref:SHOCT domain-containing protein n=1 Tax=Candidatus Mycobacterium methanotrophicum TaxID=2943498 RepID=A0ABY4QTE5_9MYCO|nr:SHOCT domain-containing protein [Candidatus Mycobacterium methanotrophicum]UQX12955.1 SHOCT domain-containing protein [Candidatus Mycobacterium methanotrophicum]
MGEGHWGWGSWILTTGISVIFWALVITAVVLVARYLLTLSQRPTATRSAGASSAEQVLAERYARGEIDDDEYKRRLALLRQNLASTASS